MSKAKRPVDQSRRSAAQYKRSETKAQKRLGHFAATPNPSDLKREIALIRSMIADAAQTNDSPRIVALTNILTKLTRSHVAAQRAVGELLEKSIVMRVAQEILAAIEEQFNGCDGYAMKLAAVAETIVATIGSATNDERERLDV